MSTLSIAKRQVEGVVIVDLAGKIALGETNRQLHEVVRQPRRGGGAVGDLDLPEGAVFQGEVAAVLLDGADVQSNGLREWSAARRVGAAVQRDRRGGLGGA